MAARDVPGEAFFEATHELFTNVGFLLNVLLYGLIFAFILVFGIRICKGIEAKKKAEADQKMREFKLQQSIYLEMKKARENSEKITTPGAN